MIKDCLHSQNKPQPRIGSILLLLCCTALAHAAENHSPAVGFLRFDCLSGSDTVVSVPFQPLPRWAGKLAAAPADQGGGVTRLSFRNSPEFETGELSETPHWLVARDGSGPVGRHFPILTNGSDSVDLEVPANELVGLDEDSLVSVVPAWTLSKLFPPATQTTLHVSTGPLATGRGSELLLYDNTTAGITLAASRRFYVTGEAWFEVGTYAAADEIVIEPGQAFVVRHAPGEAATTFIPCQEVYGDTVSLALPVAATKARDTLLAPPRPVAVTLDQLDLGPLDFIESATNDPADRKDQLLVFDNAAAATNKQPSARYFRTAGQWVRDTASFPAAGTDPIEPSAGLLFRKTPAGADLTIRWSNDPSYDVTAP